jgi:hypothetical protein
VLSPHGIQDDYSLDRVHTGICDLNSDHELDVLAVKQEDKIRLTNMSAIHSPNTLLRGKSADRAYLLSARSTPIYAREIVDLRGKE